MRRTILNIGRNSRSQITPRVLIRKCTTGGQSTFFQYFPIVGCTVGLTALSFQLFVLYPWHEIISESFKSYAVAAKRIEVTEYKLQEKMNHILQIEEEVKAKERRILDAEKQILIKIDEMIIRETEMRKEVQQPDSHS